MVEQGEGAVNMDASKFNRELAVEEAEEAVSSQDTPSEAALMALDAVADIGSIADQIQGVVNLWTPLLKQIAKFVELTDAMSNVRNWTEGRSPASTESIRADPSLCTAGLERFVCHTQGGGFQSAD